MRDSTNCQQHVCRKQNCVMLVHVYKTIFISKQSGRLFLTPDNTTHFQAVRVFSATRRTMAGSNNKFISGLYHIKVHMYCMRAYYNVRFLCKDRQVIDARTGCAEAQRIHSLCHYGLMCIYGLCIQLATCTCVVECL